MQDYIRFSKAHFADYAKLATLTLTIHAALPDESVIQAWLIGREPAQRVDYVLCMIALFLLPHQGRHLS